MVIGVMQVEIHVEGSTSLKDKRRVIKSLKDKLHRHHQVSVAEVAMHEHLTRGVLGVVLASADTRYAQSVLDRVLDQLRRTPGFVLADHRTELLAGH